jgi:hypothetical protein
MLPRVASTLLACVFIVVTACSSTEPDAAGKLGYARFIGVFRNPIDHSFPFPVVGVSVGAVCGVNLLVEYFSGQATTGADGSFSVDVDVPGNLSNPAPNRKYTCLIQGVDPTARFSPACVQVEVTFAGSASKRPVFTNNLTVGQSDCSVF